MIDYLDEIKERVSKWMTTPVPQLAEDLQYVIVRLEQREHQARECRHELIDLKRRKK